jgi:hypothetical protein
VEGEAVHRPAVALLLQQRPPRDDVPKNPTLVKARRTLRP